MKVRGLIHIHKLSVYDSILNNKYQAKIVISDINDKNNCDCNSGGIINP